MDVVDEMRTRQYQCELGATSSEFAGQVAVAVWLDKMSEEAAREALRCYAMARYAKSPGEAKRLLAALMGEYRRRREQQDLCW